jgi:hypothetical protein
VKTEPHTLALEPVPPLREGTKPLKDDGNSSTRTSSPAPPDLSPATTKRPRKDPALKVREVLLLFELTESQRHLVLCSAYISLLRTLTIHPASYYFEATGTPTCDYTSTFTKYDFARQQGKAPAYTYIGTSTKHDSGR